MNHSENTGKFNSVLTSASELQSLLMTHSTMPTTIIYGSPTIGTVNQSSKFSRNSERASTQLSFMVLKIAVMETSMLDSREEEMLTGNHWLKKMLKRQLKLPRLHHPFKKRMMIFQLMSKLDLLERNHQEKVNNSEEILDTQLKHHQTKTDIVLKKTFTSQLPMAIYAMVQINKSDGNSNSTSLNLQEKSGRLN